ncbi:MAG: IMP dehydrogenase [candidate division KSB1 bacterium]|jgi:IMP dehydrogenase|nr:IMP dehydrogenase [candidate division KSB1 bacterium]
MAKTINTEASRTLMEYRLLPGLTTERSSFSNISLRTPLVYSEKAEEKYHLNIPIVSAAMQSVSGPEMGIELAKLGGVAFIFCSQSTEQQAEMISSIKNYKAGFVDPVTVNADMKIMDLHKLSKEKGFTTFPVVDDHGKLKGIITKRDYDISRHAERHIRDRMLTREQIVVGIDVRELSEANAVLMDSHQSVLPIVDKSEKLLNLVFRKDIKNHLDNPHELIDEKKRLMAAAAVNTHDYEKRVPALVNAGVDVLAVDSSDGFSVYQGEALKWITERYPDIPVIGGNIITEEGFDYLVDAGACAIKVGMGGGSICITQEQKGTGRGLATAIIKVNEARDRYFKKTGKYIPIIADGGIVHAKDIVIALALGSDYVMMGRFFARMDESPTEKVSINNRVMKPYWGEGASRARQWKQLRYSQSKFVEGVEGFVEYAGKLRDNLDETLAKIVASMSSCGVENIKALHERAQLEVVSSLSIREGKVHDIYMPDKDQNYYALQWGD